MAKRFIVFNNKIIKFGSTGIIFDSENSGGGVVADPFRSATVTAVVENGYVKPTITGDTNNDLDHWAVYVAGQSSNKQTFKNSLSVDSIIDYFGLTAPDNSVKTYSMRIQGVTANGTTTSTSSFSIAVTGAVVEIPDADPITILSFGWSSGTGTNPIMTFTPSNNSALTYEIMSSRTGSSNTFSLGASTSFNALDALEALGYTINPGASTTVRFKVRGINTNGTSSWSSYSDTVTVARANESTTDPMIDTTITATKSSTAVSWTNLSNIETFDHYEYYLTTNASNIKTTTSTSVTIANLKTQFNLNPTTDTTYQLRVYGVSTEGNVTNTASISFIVTGSGSSEQLTITYNPLNVKSIVDDLGGSNNAAAFIITPSETVTFNMISVYYGGRVTSTSSNNHWHLDMMRISELTSSDVNATKVVDLKTDANGSVYVTGTDVDDIHTNTTGYGWHTQTGSNATSSDGIYKSRGVDTNIINPADSEATLIRYTSKLTNGNNITLEAGKTYLIGYQAAVNAGSNDANYATLVVNGMTGNSNNCLVKHSTTSDGTITAKYEAYLPYIEIGDSLDNMIPFTKFSGISSSSGTTEPETDPLDGRSLTATANATTISWTNLSAISTFANYEYYVETISINIKTTTSNSVTIETLKTQFSLADDTTYQLRVRAKSTMGNYSNLATVTFTTPAASSGGGSTDTPTVTVNRLERTFTSTADTAYAQDDGSGWYSFAYDTAYGLAVAMHEPNDKSTPTGWPDNPPAAIITLSNTEVFDGTNGVHLAADVNCIAKGDSVADIACDNGYSCLRLCFRDSSGNTSNWIDLHLDGAAIIEGTSNGVGADSGHRSMTIDLDLSSICNKSGFNKAAINAFEVHLAQWSTGTSFKERQKGLYFNNIVLTNS